MIGEVARRLIVRATVGAARSPSAAALKALAGARAKLPRRMERCSRQVCLRPEIPEGCEEECEVELAEDVLEKLRGVPEWFLPADGALSVESSQLGRYLTFAPRSAERLEFLARRLAPHARVQVEMPRSREPSGASPERDESLIDAVRAVLPEAPYVPRYEAGVGMTRDLLPAWYRRRTGWGQDLGARLSDAVVRAGEPGLEPWRKLQLAADLRVLSHFAKLMASIDSSHSNYELYRAAKEAEQAATRAASHA